MRIDLTIAELNRCRIRLADTRGQALIESAVFCCMFVFFAALAADAAWMCYAAAVTSSSARQAAVYAAQGQKSTTGVALSDGTMSQTKCSAASNELFEWGTIAPPVSTVNLAATNLNGTSWAYTEYCSSATYFAAPPFPSQPDPEAAYFTMDAAQINAGFKVPVSFSFPGIKWLSVPSEIHGRPVYMRQLN